ncbi:MAG: TlpA family protein disulfide reductase [Caulobacteraceae bacterium]
MMELGRRTLLGAAPAAFLGGLFPRVTVGKPAPRFSLVTFDNRRVSLTDLAGKVVVLNFWASWCAPCREEMAVFNAYIGAHRGDDLKLFGVDTEDSLSSERLKRLAGITDFPLAMRFSGGGYGALGGAVPTNYAIDRAGVVRYAQAGAFTYGGFDALVTPLLGAPRPARASTAT